MSGPTMRCYLLTLRCLRTKCCLALCLLACLLVLGRVFQLRQTVLRSMFRRGDTPPGHARRPNISLAPGRFVPGSFLSGVLPRNASYCKFGYSLPRAFEVSEGDVKYSPELGPNGGYRVLYNIIQPRANISGDNVTYSTHATPEFFYYLVEILRRWEGPVSVATFVPKTDASLVVCLAERLCRCLPAMSRVSLHFIFPRDLPPVVGDCPPQLASPPDCSPPYILSDSASLETFRSTESLTYPINVARNVARLKANTSFVLVSDVELFPSRNLVTNFVRMLRLLKEKSRTDNSAAFTDRLVYVVPVFEVQPNEDIPEVKSKLLELYTNNRAFYFHRWVCNHCQRFPGLQRWVLRKKPALDNSVEPFFVVRREFPFHRWEPVFIGTNSDPLYSELLTWEGQQDKMTQMHEMCLLRYRFVILDGAFLVHAPGVKRKADVVHDRSRALRLRQNSAHYDAIIQTITARRSHNYRCKVH